MSRFWLVAVAGMACAAGPPRGDLKNLPPERREFCSGRREYCLELSTSDGWKSKHALAVLRRTTPSGPVEIWRKTLPQELGPRFALLSAEGQVLLFDEWINVASRMALMFFNREGAMLWQASFADIQKAIGVPGSRMVAEASFGPWMMEKPSPGAGERSARVRTGGKTLVIDLPGGRLGVE